MASEFVEQWSLKWAEGTILGFAKGNIELNRAVGMLRRAGEIIGDDKLLAIIENIEKNPVYLPTLTPEEKAKRLKPLKDVLGRNKFY